MLAIVLVICISILFALHIVISNKERTILIELLASKDYADYKYFKKEESSSEHVNMFDAREKKNKRNEELE